jgi:hypothetical protein
MYEVFKVNRDKTSGLSFMQLVGTYAIESDAKQKASRLKGLVKRDGQIWFDYRP